MAKTNDKIVLYGSDEFSESIKMADFSLEDAKSILCEYVQENHIDMTTYSLYFMRNDYYVFSTAGVAKSYDWVLRDMSGIYIDSQTGDVKKVNDTKITEQTVELETHNYLIVNC